MQAEDYSSQLTVISQEMAKLEQRLLDLRHEYLKDYLQTGQEVEASVIKGGDTAILHGLISAVHIQPNGEVFYTIKRPNANGQLSRNNRIVASRVPSRNVRALTIA